MICNIYRNICTFYKRFIVACFFRKIISVKSNINFTDCNRISLNLFNAFRKAFCQVNPSCLNADKNAVIHSFIAFDHFVSNPGQRPSNCLFVENDSFLIQCVTPHSSYRRKNPSCQSIEGF
uniref:Uncharacterized protein n=1 Tax=Bacillus subtilis TaxID=1423 RepID=Q45482_BACIU|nr:orf-E; hypothetical protein; Method: conceptual translation supplied by author [Bacillus subtilis subsp. subtilis str. 168]